jgi:hypothetical protein
MIRHGRVAVKRVEVWQVRGDVPTLLGAHAIRSDHSDAMCDTLLRQHSAQFTSIYRVDGQELRRG